MNKTYCWFSHCTLQDGSLFVLYISTATPIIQESPFTGRLEIPFYVKARVFFCRLISHSELTFRMYRISALLGLWTSSTSMMSPDPYIHVGYVNVWKAFQRFTLWKPNIPHQHSESSRFNVVLLRHLFLLSKFAHQMSRTAVICLVMSCQCCWRTRASEPRSLNRKPSLNV